MSSIGCRNQGGDDMTDIEDVIKQMHARLESGQGDASSAIRRA